MPAPVRGLIAFGIAAFWLALFAPPMFMAPPRVYTGVTLHKTGAAVQPNIAHVDAGSPAYRAGLRTGDVLGCLTARDNVLLLLLSPEAPQAYRAGDEISTCVRRGAVLRHVSFVAQTGAPVPNSYGSNALAALRVVVVLVFFFTGIALVMGRPSLMTWIFFAYCIGNAPSFAAQQIWTILPSWQYAIAGGLPQFSSAIAVAFLLLFSILVPNDGLPTGWRRAAFYAASVLAVADIAFSALPVWYTGVTITYALVSDVDETLTALTVLIVLVRVATMQSSERARFGWAAFAIIFGVVTNDLRNVLSVGSYQSLSVVAADLTVVMPLTLLYAILRRHVIDVRFVLSRTVVFAVLTSLVVAVIGAVDWLTSAYLSQVRVAMAIDAAVTIGLAFVLHRAYGVIERGVDFLLFRHKHEAERYLHRLGKTLLRAQHEDTVDRALVHAPYEALELTMAALFRAQGNVFVVSSSEGWAHLQAPAFDSDHELVRFLATERTKLDIRDLRAHVTQHFKAGGPVPGVAIPVFQGDELTAFAVYGLHRDATRLDPDEIATLESLCECAAQAYVRIELLRYRAITVAPQPA